MLKSFLTVLCAIGLSACSTPSPQNAQSVYQNEKAALESATATGTSLALDEFLQSHPQSLWEDVAIYRRDHAALEEAKRIGTKEAFVDFLQRYPKSVWADQARYFLKYGVTEKTEKG